MDKQVMLSMEMSYLNPAIFCFRKLIIRGTRLAPVEHATLGLGVVSSSLTLGAESTLKILKKNKMEH